MFDRSLVEFTLRSPLALEWLFSLKYTMIPDERWAGMVRSLYKSELQRIKKESKQMQTTNEQSDNLSLNSLLSSCVSTASFEPSLWYIDYSTYHASSERRLSIDSQLRLHLIRNDRSQLKLLARKRYDIATGQLIQEQIWNDKAEQVQQILKEKQSQTAAQTKHDEL